MMTTALPLREHTLDCERHLPMANKPARDCAAESNSLEDMSIAEGRVVL